MYKKTILIKTNKKKQVIDITQKILEVVWKSKIREGIVVVFAKHTTCALFINEKADEGLKDDIIKTADKIVLEKDNYKHDRVDNNTQSHILSSFIGTSIAIPVFDGKLDLGTWQGIMLFELDGPREREVVVSVF